MELRIEISKTGVPCMWEEGGGFTNTGNAVIIAGERGEKKKPIYIRRRGSLACAAHALIPIKIGDYVVQANHHRDDYNIYVSKIVEIGDETARVDKINTFSLGEWDYQLDDKLKSAVRAAKEKANHYYCREPHYIAGE